MRHAAKQLSACLLRLLQDEAPWTLKFTGLFLLPLPLFHSALSSAPFSRIVAPFFSFPSIFFIARFSLMSSSWQGTEIASEGEGKVLGWPQSEGRILGSS